MLWRGWNIPSRIVLAPINTGFAHLGRPSLDLVRFHRERSGRAIGISMLGNVSVTATGASNPTTAVLRTPADVGRFAVIARAIRRRGSLPAIQLASAPRELSPSLRWRPADAMAERRRLQHIVSDLESHVLHQSLEQFIYSFKLAVRAGFEVVQIHAAHGYLLSLLLSSVVNTRHDQFAFDGPWLEEFIRELLPQGVMVSFRISVESGLPSDSDEVAATIRLASRLARSGIDLIDLSSGFYTVNRHLIYPSLRRGPAPLYQTARDLALTTGCLITFAGNILDLRTLPDDMPGNLFCSIARAFIADPDFAQKARDGRFDNIDWCQRTGHCHYFTRNQPHIECGTNRRLGRKENI
jgi:2,4-dienoyl-CoA reductase-like NADH-dependent reductase (Old Yellow Enzyme family)